MPDEIGKVLPIHKRPTPKPMQDLISWESETRERRGIFPPRVAHFHHEHLPTFIILSRTQSAKGHSTGR
jgi:hypothetical protein